MSPKRVVGCRGGSRYVEGCCGFPYLKIESFLASKFHCFKVSKFPNVNGSTFQISKVPKFQCCKLLKVQNYIVSNMCGAHFSNLSKLSNSQTYRNNMCANYLGIAWTIWSVLVSSKINHIGFGARGHVRKFRNQRNDGCPVSPIANRKVTSPKWRRIILRSF